LSLSMGSVSRFSSTTEKYQQFRMSAGTKTVHWVKAKSSMGVWHVRGTGISICPKTELLLRPSLKRSARFKRGSLMGACGSTPDRNRPALGSSPR